MKCFAGALRILSMMKGPLRGSHEAVDLDLLRPVTRRFGRAAADALEDLLAR